MLLISVSVVYGLRKYTKISVFSCFIFVLIKLRVFIFYTSTLASVDACLYMYYTLLSFFYYHYCGLYVFFV